jgi:hypothetical protein
MLGQKTMKKRLIVCFMVMSWFAVIRLSPAAITASHLVTVTVNSINEINVDNNVTLTVTTATAGSDPNQVSDNTTSNLSWTTNAKANTKKITVKTSLAAPAHTLKLLAQNIAGTGSSPGTAAAEVTLSTIDRDLITGILKTAAHCDLRYTAIALAAEGDDDDLHTITFTITNSN